VPFNKGNTVWLGRHHSEASKIKISEAGKGKIKTFSKDHIRKPFSEEHNRKIAEFRKGKIHTEETKRKISETRKEIGFCGKNSPGWKGGGIDRICKECGIKFITEKNRISNGRGIFCSKECQGVWKRKNGDQSLNNQIRGCERSKEWRQKIFIRDNFTCQKCGVLGGDIQAHHKKPLHVLIKEIKEYLPLFGTYPAAIMYTPLWDLNNGETLCRKCHNKINNHTK